MERWSAVMRWSIAVVLLAASVFWARAQPMSVATEAMQNDVFLDEMTERAVLYFVEQTSEVTGLTRDRAPANGGQHNVPASVAATGFALTSWCIADARGLMSTAEAKERVLTALRFVLDGVEHERGWLYHFVDADTGRRAWKCEVSTIDTALFLTGAITAREYFQDEEMIDLVDRIYRRIDWQWALNGGKTLSHGWFPETGFIPWRWDNYSELMSLYLLGLGAPETPLPAETWDAWKRGPVVNYGSRKFMDAGPLFTHQFSHAWFDFRNRRDQHADYWENSVLATLAQRDWSADQAVRFPKWSHEFWGLTASDSARGYVAWGGPQEASHARADGTVVPCAPAGSLPFAPAECLATLRKMREIGGERVWQRYGFVDAFNPHTGWIAEDVIGIDVGISLLMAENLRTQLVWHVFMQAPEVRRAMNLAQFREVRPAFGADPGRQLAVLP